MPDPRLAESLEEAVTETIARTPAREIGLSPGQCPIAMCDTTQRVPSFLGHGIAPSP